MTATGSADIDLVVTDLDGTLWDPGEVVHGRTLEAWAEIERRGVPVLVATGRRISSTAGPLGRVGLAPPAVCLNGALGLHLSDGRRFHRATITADAAGAILGAFRVNGLQPCVYVDRDDLAVYVDAEPSTHPDHLASFGAEVAIDDLARVCAEESVLAFSVLGGVESALAAVVAGMNGAGIPHLAADRGYGGHTLTVSGPSMSKWDGVEAFCAAEGLDPSRVLAVGDGPNDAELLAGAAVAVVPSDGHPTALAAADLVVDPPDAGGWAQILDLL